MAQVELLDGAKAKLTVSIAADVFDKAIAEAYHKSAHRYNVPGFRKGKAPRKVIENMYGVGTFYEDAFDLCWGEAYDAAVDENKLEPVDQPALGVDSIGEGEGVVFTATVQLKPEVTLGAYKGIAVPKQEYTVTDEEVAQALEQEREKQARFVSVERNVESGDRILLDYSGSVGGEKFDGGTAEDQYLVIGSNSFIPGFEEQLIGCAVGEEKDITVTFPTEYHAENLAGQKAVFHCKVKAVEIKELPEIDDAFIQDISTESDSVDAWKQNKKEKLLAEKAEKAKNQKESDALKGACDNAKVDIPDCMINRQVDYMLRDMQYRLASSGLSLEDYCKYLGGDVETLKKGYRGEAEIRVKLQLVLEAIRKAENVTPDEQEIEAVMARYAEQTGRPVEELKKEFTSDDIEYMTDRAATEKTVRLVVDSAVETAEKKEKKEKKAKNADKAEPEGDAKEE